LNRRSLLRAQLEQKENDVQNRVMKEASQENVQKAEKDSKELKERRRFVSEKEKAKTNKKIKKVEEVQKIVALSTRKKVLNKLRIIDI
jgi:hypothetical protein